MTRTRLQTRIMIQLIIDRKVSTESHESLDSVGCENACTLWLESK